MISQNINIGIIGSGASTTFFLKNLLDIVSKKSANDLTINIFDKKKIFGMGMPYDPSLIEKCHLVNITSDEMPLLLISFSEWLKTCNANELNNFGVDERSAINEETHIHPYSNGAYLHNQYKAIVEILSDHGVKVNEFSGVSIIDIIPNGEKITFIDENNNKYYVDKAIIATGHQWCNDGNEISYYKSPWPIKKILPKNNKKHNFNIGLLGASLSAFDAAVALAEAHGQFIINDENKLIYIPDEGTEEFKISMHSGHGILPHLRCEIEDVKRKIYRHLTSGDIVKIIKEGDGYLRIESYFQKFCKPALIKALKKDGHDQLANKIDIQTCSFHNFIAIMADQHNYDDPFHGMRLEFKESSESLKNKKPIHWKEVLDDLIYTLNFHAEYLPAEDQIFLQKEVMPFIMNIVAALPLESAAKLLALNDAEKIFVIKGHVELAEKQERNDITKIIVTNGKNEQVIEYTIFIDCSGQKPVKFEDYPFESLKYNGIRKAKARFLLKRTARELAKQIPEKINRIGDEYYFIIGGIDIDPEFRIIKADGTTNKNIYDIAFPHSIGIRPFSYGLQSCYDTGRIIANSITGDLPQNLQKDVSTLQI